MQNRERQSDAGLPAGGPTVRLTSQAMACDFSVIMNPGRTERITAAQEALEVIQKIESWLTIYRADSELSELNQRGFAERVAVSAELFQVLDRAKELHTATLGAFDIAAGRLNALWRDCRGQQQLPTPEQLDNALEQCGSQHLQLDAANSTATFAIDGLKIDPGGIGKGVALDAAAKKLRQTENAPNSFLIHGGHSSLIARGPHGEHRGWPVGIGNPLFTNQRLGTVVLENLAMATSGSNIQFFRHNGQRYGHILDPRTGWPVEGMLSVTVFSPSAAVADALSTAFFVLGVEKAGLCCEKLSDTGAILIPFPDGGRRLAPVVMGVLPDGLHWDPRQILHIVEDP